MRRLRGPVASTLSGQLHVRLYQAAWPLLAGAAAIYRRTITRRVRVIAVVGSFGKTTTTRAVSTAIGQRLDRQRNGTAGSGLAGALLRVTPSERAVALE